MLQNWLKPLPLAIAEQAKNASTHLMGGRVIPYTKDLPDLKKTRIAIIGFEEEASNKVREVLYSFAWSFPPATVVDLGNLRKPDSGHLIPVLFELITGKVMPIVIGAGVEASRAQFLAYQEAKALVNWVMVDEQLGPVMEQEGLLAPRHALLFHFALLGAQIHLLPPSDQQLLEKHHFEVLRLGRMRSALEEAEPLLRDADLLSIHLSSLKQSEASSVTGSPSGLLLEEACQLARYAGMSDKLTSFGVYGLDADRRLDTQSVQCVAQLVWYFMEGFFNRKGDYPASLKGLSEYVVELPAYNYHLTFWKSELTGRWWLQVPVTSSSRQERHRLIPCSFQDYQMACRQELPDRLFKAFKRF
jgi:formiminoglutamase